MLFKSKAKVRGELQGIEKWSRMLGDAYNKRKDTKDVLVHHSVYKETSSKVHYLLTHIRSQD